MNKKLRYILRVLGGVLTISIIVSSLVTSYFAGFSRGIDSIDDEMQKQLDEIVAQEISSITEPTSTPTSKPTSTQKPKAKVVASASWGGPQLWEAVNQRRSQLGVNPLSVREEICTIASIRLNQILQLGTLDGHEGFSKLRDSRPDLKPIFDKYNLSEFLVAGATSPSDVVALWENSLGHKQLLTGGEYVWGCVYAQGGFGVAIAAY